MSRREGAHNDPDAQNQPARPDMGQQVPIMAPEFQSKREEWIDCLAGDDCNSIIQQLYRMTWDAAVFRVLVAASECAPAAAEGGIEMNRMVQRFINRCFFTRQFAAIRRLTAPEQLCGKRASFSLRSLVEDMNKHIHLLTRQNLCAAEQLPMDAEPLREQHDEYVRQKSRGDGNGCPIPQHLDYEHIEERHAGIDRLCGVSEEDRTPNDHVTPEWFDAILQKLDVCNNIVIYVNKFIAHAAAPWSRDADKADDIRIRLRDLWEVHEILCRVGGFLGTHIIPGSIGLFLPDAVFDKFRYIDRPLVTRDNVAQLVDAWQRFEHETQGWHDNNLDWCLNPSALERNHPTEAD